MGRQVDRFCRCVKKVRKTVKVRKGSTAEGAAIAICTKSVLQTRKRTLRKVRCRDRVLLTQPMKGGGVLGAGEYVVVLGGDDWSFLPLYAKDTPKNPVLTNKLVQSLIGNSLGPRDVVAYLGDASRQVDKRNNFVRSVAATNPYIKMITNPHLAEYPPDQDDINSKIVVGGKLPKGFDEDSALNICLITLRYGTCLDGKDPATIALSLADIMIGLVHINGAFVQCDLHTNNTCLMQDGCPVIVDYGTMRKGDTTYFGDFLVKIQESSYISSFEQYTTIAAFLHEHVPAGSRLSEADQRNVSKIFDLLSLLVSVEKLPSCGDDVRAFRAGLLQGWQSISQSELHNAVTALNQRIVKKVTGKDWKAMTLADEVAMADEYLKHAGPARNRAGLWEAVRNHYRFGAK